MQIEYNEYLQKSQELISRVSKADINSINVEYIKRVLSLSITEREKDELFKKAQEIRNRNYGNNVYIRASIEFSNVCNYTCKFCGMSINNKKLKRYTLDNSDIFKIIDQVCLLGITQIHLVSGESQIESIEDLCTIIKYIKSRNLFVTLVLGRRSIEDYLLLKDAGADRYILKFETSNEEIYFHIKGNTYLDERIADLLFLRGIGFKIGTGIIVGLPKTSIDDLARDLLLLKLIAPDMASVSVFSPNEHSEFSDEIPGDNEVAMLFVALIRIYLVDNPPMISCSSSFGKKGQMKVIKAGANVLSYHATPKDVIDLYSAYKGNNRVKSKLDQIYHIALNCDMTIKEYK